MEDNKDNLVVIFAGYSKEMQEFIRANSGIQSRIGYTFEFADYTEDELYDIFDLPNNFVVKSTIDISGMNLDALPGMSTISVNGDFWCPNNKLTNLYGAPYSVSGHCKFGYNPLNTLYGMPKFIGGNIYLSNTQLTAKSFVPLYMENKLDDIVGVDEKVIAAWREQIAVRKNKIANIVDMLNNYIKR